MLSLCFKGENHQSDMTIGDYWGIKENDQDTIKGFLLLSYTIRRQKIDY